MRFSALKQINTRNVATLKPVWTFHTLDAGNGSTIECTPIVVGGVMYLTTARLRIVALDAVSGKAIWVHDPKAFGVNRGVAYWTDGKVSRILVGLPDGRLLSLDARTGKLDTGFGKGGTVHLREGYERDLTGFSYGATSAPSIYENLVIVPIQNSETQPGAPGDVRAFDVRTGREVWRFHTVPQPYEFGNDTWAEGSWKNRSGVNAWSGYTVDTKNGLVFAATGSAAADFYGGDRKGNNLFANCIIALNARTGQRVWHFQTVHHDLWDADNPCPPVLCVVKGKEAVALPTKTGFIYVFERRTVSHFSRSLSVLCHPLRFPASRLPALNPCLWPRHRYHLKYSPPMISPCVQLKLQRKCASVWRERSCAWGSGACRQAWKAPLSRPAIMAVRTGQVRLTIRLLAYFLLTPTTCRV
jgi:quinoprotein glucose dehydrogenase